LFIKLGHYRQKIKDKPWVVYGHNIEELLYMKSKLDEARDRLTKFLFLVKEKLLAFKPENGLIDFAATADHINECYATINVNKANNQSSEFEKENKDLIEGLTNLLDVRVRNLSKERKSLEKQISKEEEVKKDLSKKLASLTIRPKKCSLDKQTTQNYEFIAKNYINTNLGKKIWGLSTYINDEALNGSNLQEKEKLIISIIRNRNEPVKADASKIKVIESLLPKYKKSLDKAINEYNKGADVINWIKVDDYDELFNRINKHEQGEDGTEKSKLINQIKASDNRKKELEQQLEKVNVECAKSTPLIDDRLESKETDKLSRPKVDGYKPLLLKVIKETEFLSYLYTELEKAKLSNDEVKYQKLLMAEKMSFGFLGQYYKDINDKFKNELDINLIENSILSQDIFKVILIRHKQLLHNTFSCDDDALQKAVKNKIVPWLKDFKCMATLLLEESGNGADATIDFSLFDSRLIDWFEELKDKAPDILYSYTKLVILNRFLRSVEAINEYEKIDFSKDIDPELLTEIYWQASLAYENLGKFNDVIQALELSLIKAKEILDRKIRIAKIRDIRLNLVLAYIQINKLVEATENLEPIIRTNQKIAHDQVIKTNFLQSNIDLLLGYNVLAQSFMELNFLKAFTQTLETNPRIALSSLNAMASRYLDERNIPHARDCINFAIEIFEKYRADLIAQYGQYMTYAKLILHNNLARYKMIEILSKPISEPKRLEELKNNHTMLLEEKDYRDYLSSLEDRKNSNKPLLMSIILGNGTREEGFNLLRNKKQPVNKDCNKTLQEVKSSIYEIKQLLTQSVLKSQLNLQDAFIPYVQKKVDQLTDNIILTLYELSIQEFVSKNFNLAKELMKKTLLYQVLDHFIFFEIRKQIQESTIFFDNVDNAVAYIKPKLLIWQNALVNDQDLKKHLNKMLTETGYYTDIFGEKHDTITEEYKKALNDKAYYKTLIGAYENNFMLALFSEKGVMTMQTKIDQEEKSLIQKVVFKGPGGKLGIKRKVSKIDVVMLNQQIIFFNKAGAKNFRLKKYQDSVSEYTKAIKLIERYEKVISDSNIKYLTALFNRGRAYQENGDVDEAIDDYENAISINNNHAKSHQYLGLCYYKRGKLEKAKRFLKKALKNEPNLTLAKEILKNIN
jgi:tetratricopeptide (TPR) repeat protein